MDGERLNKMSGSFNNVGWPTQNSQFLPNFKGIQNRMLREYEEIKPNLNQDFEKPT